MAHGACAGQAAAAPAIGEEIYQQAKANLCAATAIGYYTVMDEGIDRQAMQRIEAALERIERAANALARPADGHEQAGSDALRGKVQKAMADLDLLIADLEP